MGVCRMDEKDIEKALNHMEAAIACGGGTVTDESRQLARDIMSGRLTVEDAIRQVKQEYGVSNV